MDKKLNVGVVGVGALGRYHSGLYAKNPSVNMIGVFDVNGESAKKVGAEFGLPVFDSWQALADKCDALSVAVPATYHGSTVLPLLEQGKHILVEKPIASTLEDGEKMVSAARKNNCILAVGHVERFNPALDIMSEYPGKICFIEAHRLAKYPPKRPGLPPRGTEVSVTLDLMIHDIELVMSLIRSEVIGIEAFGSPVLSPGDDVVKATLRFADGSCADITASRIVQNPARRMRIFQKDCYLSLDLGNHSASVFSRGDGELLRKDVVLPEKNALAEELDDFVQSVLAYRESGNLAARPVRVSGNTALAALKVALEVEKISRLNREKAGF